MNKLSLISMMTVTELSLWIQKLTLICSHHSTDPSIPRSLQSRKLEWVDTELKAIKTTVDSKSMDTTTGNICRLQLYQEKIADLRRDLALPLSSHQGAPAAIQGPSHDLPD